MSERTGNEPDSVLTRQLIAQYLAGNKQAADRLFREYEGFLLKEARRHPAMKRLRRHVSAEDVAHEVWSRLKMDQGLRRFEDRGRGSFGAWLCTILNNTFADLERRYLRQKRGSGKAPVSLSSHDNVSYEASEPASQEQTPTSNARNNERLTIIRRTLSERDWTIWRLKVLDGQTNVEIGKLMSLPVGTVGRILHDAKKKIILALEGDADDA